MATFVTTTLAKRTGATTTVFTPAVITDGMGVLYAPGTLAGYSPYLTMLAKRQGSARKTILRAGIPQLDAAGKSVLYRPWAQIEMHIPDGTLQTDVNDLVGYLNALSSTSQAHIDDLLVDGAGVF